MKVSTRWIVERIKERQKDKKDIYIAITGYEGEGKSTLAWDITNKHQGKNFSWEKNFVFSPSQQDTIKQLKALERGSVLTLDEGIKTAYKREWYKLINRTLEKVATLNRNERKCVIICIPNFLDLTTFFREHRILLWIHVVERGRGLMFIRYDNFFGADKWNIKENFKSLNFYAKKIIDGKMDVADVFRNSPNFLGEIKFDKMPDAVELEYDFLKDKYKYEDLEEEAEDGSLKHRWFVQLMKLTIWVLDNMKVTQKQVASILGVSARVVGQRLSRWENKEQEQGKRNIIESKSKNFFTKRRLN